jgi:hypothetical protein
MSETTDMWVLLIALALALLSMVLVLWAIREQARTREY